MDWLQLVLRIVHIFAGVAWVGGAALFFFYIEPTINKLGPDAERFVEEVVNRRRLPVYFGAVSTLAVLSGLILYWRDSNGLQLTWITSPQGLAFTIGGLTAIGAWLGGAVFVGPAVERVAAVGAEIKAAGGPPAPELLARMHVAQERLRTIGLIDLILLGITVLAMAVARYLG